MARKIAQGDSERIRRLKEQSKNLTGFDKALMDDLLAEYDALASMVEGLRHDVQEHGVMVTKIVGAHNPREDTVENPEFTTYQKGIARLGDLCGGRRSPKREANDCTHIDIRSRQFLGSQGDPCRVYAHAGEVVFPCFCAKLCNLRACRLWLQQRMVNILVPVHSLLLR